MPLLNNLSLKGSTLLRFTDIHKLNSLFYIILLNDENYKFRIVNAVDNEYYINVSEFVGIIKEYSPKEINIIEDEDLTSNILSSQEKKINEILHSFFGFYLLSKYNNVKISSDNVTLYENKSLLTTTHKNKIEILRRVIFNSTQNKFKINNLNLGPMPIL